MNQLDYYRHEALHSAWVVQEMLNRFVSETHYSSLVNNPKLEDALNKANQALHEVYSAIDEKNEVK